MFLSDLFPETLQFALSFAIKFRRIGGSNQDDDIKRLSKIEDCANQRPYLTFYFVSRDRISALFANIDADANFFSAILSIMNYEMACFFKGIFR